MKRIVKILVATLVVYFLFVGVVFAAMYQTPSAFAGFMARLPGFAMRAVPFPPLWNVARAGHLRPGDPAPDFDLFTTDKSARVRLSSHKGVRPVVLVFGSYT